MAKLTDKNRLSITHPELSKEWNYEKNGDLKPEDVSYASAKRVWWKCKNGHVWSALIHSRTDKGYGCNSCYNRAGQMADITIDKPFSYLIGFAQADGSMCKGTRNRGKFEIMINYCDRNVIESFGEMIPCNNTICVVERNNIKVNGRVYHNKKYSLLRVCNKGFRDFIEKCGMPYGKKSKIVKPPLHLKDLSIEDYLRGLYDADGSVGFTAQGFPFLSLTTQSTEIAEYVIHYIAKTTGKPIKKMSSPKRDDVYNIMITREDAVAVVNQLYYIGCLSINRKYEKAQIVKKWERDSTVNKITFSRKYWNTTEDDIVLENTIEESMAILGRTKKSIQIRKIRLENPLKYNSKIKLAN